MAKDKDKDSKEPSRIKRDGETVIVTDDKGNPKVVFHGGVGEIHEGGEFHEDFHF